MKKYKLIKEYPYSPEVGIIVSELNGYNLCNVIKDYPEFWQEVKEPLFITEDGVRLYDLTERVFGVCPKGSWETNYYSGDGIPLEILDFSLNKVWKYFSTKGAAEQWIRENKPRFSEKQVLDALYAHLHKSDYDSVKKELGL